MYYAHGGGPVEIPNEKFEAAAEALKEYGAGTLLEILGSYGWKADLNKEGIEYLFFEHGEYSACTEDIFYDLAPFVCEGHIDMTGEDGDSWQFAFIDGEMEQYTGRIMFPGSPYNDPY